MGRQILIALLTPFVQTAVQAVEAKWGTDVPGANKRLAAFKLVKDSIFMVEHIMGALGIPIDDSVIFGLIDSVVAMFHLTGDFEEHTTDQRHYDIPAPPAAFQVTDGKSPDPKWIKINQGTGELQPVKLITSGTGKPAPAPEELMVQQSPAIPDARPADTGQTPATTTTVVDVPAPAATRRIRKAAAKKSK